MPALTYPELEQFDVLPPGASAVAWAEHRRFDGLSEVEQARELVQRAEATVAMWTAACERVTDADPAWMASENQRLLSTARVGLIHAGLRLAAAEEGRPFDHDEARAAAALAAFVTVWNAPASPLTEMVNGELAQAAE